MSGSQPNRAILITLLAAFTIALLWSAIHPHDYFTWALETFPAIIGLIILLATYKKFPFTTLVYFLICAHCIILMVGGHYTYAEVPLFNWIRDHFHQSRNNYDKVGHFAQGFVPAMVAREILWRRRIVTRKGWLFFLCIAICGMITATYELLEWGVSEATGTAADAFLGTQGDPWDTQKDMMWCFIGAFTALLTLSRIHDRMMRAFTSAND
jgi:putative membrane protein